MKKTLIRSTMLLVTISLGAKLLSFLVRITLARSLSVQAMNYYTLAAPTMVFVITLAQMGIPGALSKVVAQSTQTRKPLLAGMLMSFFGNLFIAAAFLFLIPWLAHTILKQEEITPVLYAILPLIPFVSLSGLLKGYLFGVQRPLPASACQLFEEASRILFLYLFFAFYPSLDAVSMAKIAMLSISVGEICSCLYMLCVIRFPFSSLPRLPSLFLSLQKQQFDEVLRVSIPMTGSRMIGSLTYFLEPMIMVLGLQQAEAQQMVEIYAQLNGYLLPIITMPSFLTITLSNVLLPSFTYHYSRRHTRHAQRLFSFILLCCFLCGLTCSLLCYLFPEQLLQLFYHSSRGAHTLKLLAIPFALYSLQPVLSSMLHALSLSKKSMNDTFFGSFLRLACVALFARILQGNALLLGLCAGMLATTLAHAIRLSRSLRNG